MEYETKLKWILLLCFVVIISFMMGVILSFNSLINSDQIDTVCRPYKNKLDTCYDACPQQRPLDLDINIDDQFKRSELINILSTTYTTTTMYKR